MPRYLEELYPRSTLEVIEIDPEVTRVAFDQLGLRPDTRVVTYHQDARVAMARLPEGSYDLVIGDAFNDVAAPYHLTTREFNEDVRAMLDENGIYAINLIDHLHSGRFVRSYVHTLRQTFPYVYLVRDDAQWDDDGQSTYVVIGSLQAVSPSALEEANIRAGSTRPVSSFMPEGLFYSWLASGENTLLTDDHAPVENLLAPTYLARHISNWAGRRYDAGVTLQDQGKLREALAEFDRAVRLDPELASSYYSRGQTYEELGLLQSAIQDYDRLIQLMPGYADAYFTRGQAREKLGQLQPAIQDYDQAIHLDPQYSLAYHNRGTTYGYGSLGQLPLAIRDFDQAVRLDPEYALAYYNRGLTVPQAGPAAGSRPGPGSGDSAGPPECPRPQQPGYRLHEAGPVSRGPSGPGPGGRPGPQYAVAYNNRGTAYLDSGQSRQSIQSYDQAIRLDPRYGQAYNNRGTAYQELGQHQRSIEDFDRAIQLEPRYPVPDANRAVAHSHLDMDSLAQQDAQRAVELGFDRSLLLKALEEAR